MQGAYLHARPLIDRPHRQPSQSFVPHFTVVADRQRADVRRPLIGAENPEGTGSGAILLAIQYFRFLS